MHSLRQQQDEGPSSSLLQDSHSCSMKAQGAFVLKALAQNGVLGRRRQRDPNSAGRALRRPSGHQGWLQISHTNFMTLNQSLHPPISLNKQPLSFLSVLSVWITDV